MSEREVYLKLAQEALQRAQAYIPVSDELRRQSHERWRRIHTLMREMGMQPPVLAAPWEGEQAAD
jgi:hypothetical protein